MSRTEVLQEEIRGWQEYRQKYSENQAICSQVAERHPLAYQYLEAAGIEVLEHITWDEIAHIDQELQSESYRTWEEDQARFPALVGEIRKGFPRLAGALEAMPQTEIESVAFRALVEAARANRLWGLNKVVVNVLARRTAEGCSRHPADEALRPRSGPCCWDPKRPLPYAEA